MITIGLLLAPRETHMFFNAGRFYLLTLFFRQWLILLFGFNLRWKNLQRAVLIFCAIHQKIEDNLPSGSSPYNWLADAKQAYFDKEG
jgi:hypothetical protein